MSNIRLGDRMDPTQWTGGGVGPAGARASLRAAVRGMTYEEGLQFLSPDGPLTYGRVAATAEPPARSDSGASLRPRALCLADLPSAFGSCQRSPAPPTARAPTGAAVQRSMDGGGGGNRLLDHDTRFLLLLEGTTRVRDALDPSGGDRSFTPGLTSAELLADRNAVLEYLDALVQRLQARIETSPTDRAVPRMLAEQGHLRGLADELDWLLYEGAELDRERLERYLAARRSTLQGLDARAGWLLEHLGPTPSVDAVEEPPPDEYALRYELMDTDASLALAEAMRYNVSALARINSLQNAHSDAERLFSENSKLQDAASLWEGLGVALILAAADALPAIGPIARYIRRVANEGFWAEAIKEGIELIASHLAVFGVTYTGADSPGVGRPTSIPRLIEACNRTVEVESDIWTQLHGDWRRAWMANHESARPRAWGPDRLENLRAMMCGEPAPEFDGDDMIKYFEEMLWREHLRTQVQGGVVVRLFDSGFEFSGISRASLDYLLSRFDWGVGRVAASSAPLRGRGDLFVEDEGAP
jgi:hypothetical protein